jgi:hypothetical protein
MYIIHDNSFVGAARLRDAIPTVSLFVTHLGSTFGGSRAVVLRYATM